MVTTPIVHGKLSSGWHWSNSPNNPPHALSLSYLQFFTTVKWHNHTGISKTAYTFMFQYIIQNLRWTLIQYTELQISKLFQNVRFWKASGWRWTRIQRACMEMEHFLLTTSTWAMGWKYPSSLGGASYVDGPSCIKTIYVYNILHLTRLSRVTRSRHSSVVTHSVCGVRPWWAAGPS